jgi:hypothetical protein
MHPDLALDEALIQRLPLPLAQLYRRAHNAKTPVERHLTAYYLWEAALKLLASVAVIEYAHCGETDAELTDRLKNLARPALGHWWEFLRRLTPVLAEKGDEPFRQVRNVLLGRTRDDCPRAAGLDAALRETLEGKSGARATVCFTELFDRLVVYRNKVVGHAAPGQLKDAFNERMARTILAGVSEILVRLDPLAGRRLIYVSEVRQVGGVWLIHRYELVGEAARRIDSMELPRAGAGQLPDGERVYLMLSSPGTPGEESGVREVRSLHPLLLYDAETEECLFLNARRGRRRTFVIVFFNSLIPSSVTLVPLRCSVFSSASSLTCSKQLSVTLVLDRLSVLSFVRPARFLRPSSVIFVLFRLRLWRFSSPVRFARPSSVMAVELLDGDEELFELGVGGEGRRGDGDEQRQGEQRLSHGNLLGWNTAGTAGCRMVEW